MIHAPVVLLVDDDDDFLHVARRAISRSGVNIRLSTARDGEEALQVLASQRREHRIPAVVLLDLNMPVLDGWDVLRRMRSHAATRQIPVVVVSSSVRPTDVRKSYELGANSFVVKRFDASEPGRYLVDAIRYWIDLNEPPPSQSH